MTDQPDAGTDVATVPALSPELARRFADMAMLIPSETGDATENILEVILAAPSWEDLSAPWETSKVDKLAGRVLRIDSVVRRPSDFKEGLGIFLVVRYVDVTTGEAGVFTTSSFSVVAQLVRAYAAGWLPLYASIIVAERATERGYKPHHLKVTGIHADRKEN